MLTGAIKLFATNYNLLVLLISIVISLIALYTDLKEHKIYNQLTFSAMILGVLCNLAIDYRLWYLPLFGILLGFVILFIPFSLGGIGAGDVKLLMALGAFLGAKAIIWITLFAAIAGGIISAGAIIKRHGLNSGLYRIYLIFTSIWNQANRQQVKNLETTEKIYIPYGLAIFIGLIIVVLWRP